MTLLAAAILGLIQALTEFLPVSSSGHLVLGKALLDVQTEGGTAFEVAVHFGTLLSVLLLFRADVARLIGATLRWLRAPKFEALRTDPDLRFVSAIVVGCVPAGVVGLLFKDQLEQAFDSPHLVGAALLGTGVVLLLSSLAKPGDRPLTWGRAALIGVAQAVAIIPGVSRSGSTIATALFLGVERELAARYSFLLSLPVIFGATLLKAKDLLDVPPTGDMGSALAVGATVSFVVGVAALWLLMAVVRKGWFPHFGWYCLSVGAAALIWL